MSGSTLTRHHPITVAAPRHLLPSHPPDPAPLILERGEDFIPSLLADLAHPEGRQALLASIASTPAPLEVQGRLVSAVKLFQPIQRRFHLALIEAWCDVPGFPRLDPGAVAAAGLVIRRLTARDAESAPAGLDDFHRCWQVEGWMRSGERALGWLPVDPGEDGLVDPSPQLRASLRSTRVAGLDRLLLPLLLEESQARGEEAVVPMFVAPPEACRASGHTCFYGLIPTASQERAAAPADIDAALERLQSGTDFLNHLVGALRGIGFPFPDPPDSERRFNASWKKAFDALASQEAPVPADGQAPGRGPGPHWQFRQLLWQLAVEFDAFGESASSEALRQTLRRIPLPCRETPVPGWLRTVPADQFLRQAARILLEGEPMGTLEMPLRWPELEEGVRDELRQRLSQCLREQLSALVGRRGRYDQEGAVYAIRSFIRLKPRDGCPARTVWSGYSRPFVIAAWYESVPGADPVAIPLPDVSDRNQLRALRPNVSFVVPGKLADLLQSEGSDLLEGKSGGGSLGIQWICTFSLPTITLCAFIVLNIFLSLLNIFLGWLAYVKVCLPFPQQQK
jgi:hypothetical protein